MAPFGRRKDGGARDHAQAISSLCCMCGRKRPGLEKISLSIESLIQRHLPEFSLASGYYPTSICITCRLTIKAFEKNPEQTERKFPPLIDYNLIYPSGVSTRTSSKPKPIMQPGVKCPCALCEISRKNLDYPAWHKQHSNTVMQPKNEEKTSMKVCKMCWTEIRRGLNHRCSNKRSKYENLTTIVRSNSDKTVSAVVCNGLKAVSEKKTMGDREDSVDLQSGGPRKLRVRILQGNEKKSFVTHKDFLAIQRTIGCSDRKLLGLRRCLAVILGEFDFLSLLAIISYSYSFIIAIAIIKL